MKEQKKNISIILKEKPRDLEKIIGSMEFKLERPGKVMLYKNYTSGIQLRYINGEVFCTYPTIELSVMTLPGSTAMKEIEEIGNKLRENYKKILANGSF